MHGAIGGRRSPLLPVHMWIPNMPVLLESNPGRREWSLSGLSEGLSGEPGRFHPAQSRAGSSNKDGEEGARAEAAEQDSGVAASARECSRRAEQPRVRRGAARAARGSRDPKKTGVLWQIWQNSQSSYKPKYNVCRFTGSVRVRVRDVRVVGGRPARHPGRQQRRPRRTGAEGLARHHQVLRQLHEEPALPQARLHVPARAR